MASRHSRSLRSFGIFLVVAFLTPLLVLYVFWFVRLMQGFLGDPGAWVQAPSSLPAQAPLVSVAPGQACPSRLAGNLVVVNCVGAPRLVQLLGLRVAPPATFEQVLGKVVESQVAPVASPPSAPATALKCNIFEPSDALTEPLAQCDVGGDDVGLAALRSGLVVLSQTGTVSRALLQGRALEDSYVKAEAAARLERRGVWWDYPVRGGGDPIAWRLRQDAQEPNAAAVGVSIQAWIAQVLVLAGGVVAFLFERGREASLERDRQMRLVDTLRLTIEEIETATSVADWTAADALALTITQMLAAEQLSPQVRRRWNDVVHQLQGHPDVVTLLVYTAKFNDVLKKDPTLGLIAQG